jgi:RNA recognition motif-containing protein
VNITEKPLTTGSVSLQAREPEFVDSPYKVYVGNLAKNVTSDTLKSFFEKGKALSAKVSRIPGTSKSSGFGFVTFSSDEDVEAAISSFNDAVSCLLLFLFICKLSHPDILQNHGPLCSRELLVCFYFIIFKFIVENLQ